MASFLLKKHSVQDVYVMIKSIVQRLEDPERPLLGPNLWMLRTLGLIMPKNKLAWFAYLVLHETVTLFVVTQYMEIYTVRSDLDQVLTNMKISMLSIVCVGKSNACVYWQKNFLDVIDYITTADMEERADKNTKRGSIIDSYTSYCHKITYFYWILVFTTFVTVTTTPLLLYVTDVNRPEDAPFEHIFSAWVPFDKNSSPGCWITIVWHVIMCAYGAGTMMAFDVSVMVMMVFFGGKLDLLRNRCTTILGTLEEDLSDDEANMMFRKVHHIHCEVMRYSHMFNSVLSPVMFLYVIMCSLMLSSSAYQLTSATTAIQKLLMAEYVVFGIAQLFMFCWHSNIVLYKSDQVMEGPYESKWWAVNVKQRRCLLLLTGQFRKRIFFTAGPFTNLTLSTFITILKGAYSYYTLIQK